LDKKQLSERDIRISITGDRGMIGLVPAGLPPAYINQHIALARPSSCFIQALSGNVLFFTFALAVLKRPQRGIKNSLGLEDIRNVTVLLPPLAERVESWPKSTS
jgi:type I restriction enzyme, S subunit